MAEVNTGSDSGKGGKTHAKKQSTRIDMTPMVDLAFLLLTFFMLTATFNKPQTLEINMPVPDPENQTEVPKDVTTTFLISKDNKLFYYDGVFDPLNPSSIKKTDFSKDGVRKLLMDKNQIVISKIDALEEKLKNKEIVDTVYKQQVAEIKKNRANKGRIIIIKPEGEAAYANVVNIVDEMSITNVISFALVEISPEEKAAIGSL